MSGRRGARAIVGKDSKTEFRNNAPVINRPDRNDELGDFTTTWRVVPISLLATVIGVVCAFVALALLRLIGLFTNLFYFGRWFRRLATISVYTAFSFPSLAH